MSNRSYISIVAWLGAIGFLVVQNLPGNGEHMVVAPGLAIHVQHTISAPVPGVVQSLGAGHLDAAKKHSPVAVIVDPVYYKILSASTQESGLNEDDPEEISELIMNYDYTTSLRTPLTGVVTDTFVLPGESVLLGQAILTLTAPATDHVLAYVSEEEAASISLGDRALVFTSTFELKGKVSALGVSNSEMPNELDLPPFATPLGVPVKILFDEENVGLRHLQRVDVQILVGENDDTQ